MDESGIKGFTGLTKRPRNEAGEALCRELFTLRDWLRYAVSRFNAEGLVYGHGTTTALDEAAYLLLWALHLPIDELEPWLDARLSRAERRVVFDLIEARITTRRPAPYLTGEGYIKGYQFRVDNRVIVPRSFIGELLADGTLCDLFPQIEQAETVLDLCTGSGCLAIILATHCPHSFVDAADLCEDALSVARLNVSDYGLADRVSLLCSDLFESLPSARRYDLIISNPPYVT